MQDIESEFANAEVKRDALLAKEKRLGEVIQPDDLNVLHQRIRLLNKQWDELRNQASLRVQRINDNMFRWSSFNERIRDLMEWIDQMEVKVISTKEYHIEDLLTKMQKVCLGLSKVGGEGRPTCRSRSLMFGIKVMDTGQLLSRWSVN